jgi:thiamine biosynthesis lipoprotein ApbE
MKTVAVLLFIILLGCGQSQIKEESEIQEPNKQQFANDSVIIRAVSSNDETADASFKYFEERIANESDVPYNLV